MWSWMFQPRRARRPDLSVGRRQGVERGGLPGTQRPRDPDDAAALGDAKLVPLATPDVSGSFIIPYAAKDATGCYATFWFDMTSGNSGPFSSCLTPASRVATSPLVLPPDSEVAGALVGPPTGTAPAGVSSTVMIANADNDSMLTATLSADASALTSTAAGDFLATIPGPPAQTMQVNGQTGAVTTVNTPAGGGGGGAAGAATGGPTAVNVNGLTHIVTAPVQIAAGQYGLVVADDPEVPTQAAYAVVQVDGTLLASQSFPSGWLPLIPTKPTAGAAAVLETARFDAAGKTVYLLARAADASQDGFVTLPYDASTAPSLITMPSGWFATSCGGAVKLTAVTLHPASVFPGSNVAETGYSNPCQASGFLVLDLTSQTVSSYPLGANGQMNSTTLTNFNDFIYATDLDRAVAGTVFVLDAVSPQDCAIGLPAAATPVRYGTIGAGTNWLLAEVTNRNLGDGGLSNSV